MSKDTMSFCDGKYTVTSDNGALYAHRHGEPWNRDLTGDNLVYWMLVDALALKQERDELAESERSCREDNQKFLAEIDALKAEVGALKAERDAFAAALREIDRDKVRDAIADALGGMIYCCTRQWSAWAYGTMSQNDFVLASEDDGILDELTAAAISAIEAKLGSAS